MQETQADEGLIPQSERCPGRDQYERQPTLVFLPGECHGEESGGLDMTEATAHTDTHTHTHTYTHTHSYDMDTNLYLAQMGYFQFMSNQEIYNIRVILLILRLIIKLVWCLSGLNTLWCL